MKANNLPHKCEFPTRLALIHTRTHFRTHRAKQGLIPLVRDFGELQKWQWAKHPLPLSHQVNWALIPFVGAIQKGNKKGHFYTLGHFLYVHHTVWETHRILTQNLKVISVLILPHINTSTFLTNVRLTHTAHICNSFSTTTSSQLNIFLKIINLTNEQF